MQGSILLAASTEKGMALLQSLMPPGDEGHMLLCQNGGEVRRAVGADDYSAIIINTPLTDENGLELAIETARMTSAAVILLVKADLAENVAVRMEEFGVLVVAKPLARPLFDQALRCGLASRRRILALREENDKLQKKLAEQRVTSRAKCLLIQYEGFTEEQAHRRIEKQAMDTRSTRLNIAKEIISRYED